MCLDDAAFRSDFPPVRSIKPLLTVSFLSGDISLMNNYDDLSPTVIRSGLKGTVVMAALGPERYTWRRRQ